jgi:hypothetical protein
MWALEQRDECVDVCVLTLGVLGIAKVEEKS